MKETVNHVMVKVHNTAAQFTCDFSSSMQVRNNFPIKCVAVNSVHCHSVKNKIYRFGLFISVLVIIDRIIAKGKFISQLYGPERYATGPVIYIDSLQSNETIVNFAIKWASLSLTNYSARQKFDNFIRNSRRKEKNGSRLSNYLPASLRLFGFHFVCHNRRPSLLRGSTGTTDPGLCKKIDSSVYINPFAHFVKDM